MGERTEALCRQRILEHGVPESNVVIVSDAPFLATLAQSFRVDSVLCQEIVYGGVWWRNCQQTGADIY